MTAPDGSESDWEYSFAQRQQLRAEGFAYKLYFNSLTLRCISCIIPNLTTECNA